MDERLRELERACMADPGPLNQDRLHAERARLGRPVPPRLAGSWVEDEIARGGFFSVRRVLHRESATYQALCLYPLHVLDDPHRRSLERRAALAHPAIPALYELGEATWAGEPVLYARQELVQGETLEQRRGLDWRAVCRLVAPLCSALQALHDAGLVHANLSPDNLHLTPGGQVSIVGWSRLHRFAPEPDPRPPAAQLSAVEHHPPLPYFVAPE